jgi:hypothetical protein
MMAIRMWPNWICINIKNNVRFLSLLPFNKARTRAIMRIGPHNKDIISILVCGLLGD